MPDGFWHAVLDPNAPLPAGWPAGALGAFFLFCVPIGGGIPAGVLMASTAGVSPAIMAVLYFVSDIFLALTFEPFVRLVSWLGHYLPPVAWLVGAMRGLAARSGATAGGAKGPLGLVLVSFGIDPMTGRAAAAAAGHGFIPGWSLAIAGDMLYFLVLMASTLWLQGMFGDQRLTVGVVLLIMLVLPSIVRRLSRRAGWTGEAPERGRA